MARDEEEPLTTDQKVRRSVARTLANWTVVIASLAVIGGWAATGIYVLEPDEAAVILRLGRFQRTEARPGLRWHLPPPLQSKAIVSLTEIRKEKFGVPPGKPPAPGEETATGENAIQTVDSNIVNLSYEVQYRLLDPFTYVYGMARPEVTLREAAQAAVREVVGRTSVEGVLAEERSTVQRESRELLQGTLDGYFAAIPAHKAPFEIESISLLVVQPPTEVQDAFDDVTSAQQDEARALSIALGDAKEIEARAIGESSEITEAARAYRDSTVLEAKGRAQRFEALLAEYRRAPEVTRRRLYLETMEQVLPGVDKVIVEPDTVQLMPFFPLLDRSQGGRGAPAPEAAPGVASPPEPKP